MKHGKRILSGLLALLIALSCALSAGAKTAQPSAASAVVTVQASRKMTFPKATYRKIYKELNAAMKGRGFSDTVKTFLREILYYKCKFYCQWSTVYPDLPDLESYLRENFLGALKNANTIRAYDEKSGVGRILQAQDDAAGITDADFNIRFYYANPDRITPAEHLADLEVLDHELKHCKDKQVTFDLRPFENSADLSDIMIEGGATFHEQLVGPVSANQDYVECIANRRRTRQLGYGKSTAAGYFMYLYLYSNLVYLAGYRVVEDVSLGKPIAAVKNALAKKYGRDAADQIWAGEKKLKRLFDAARSSTDPYRYALKLQDLFFQCIKKDIKRLSTDDPKAVGRYLESYRFYKLSIMPQLYDMDYDVYTGEVFDTLPLDRLLIKRIVASGALPAFSADEALNRMALTCLLYTDIENYGSRRAPCYVAPTLAGTKLKVATADGAGRILMQYPDGFGNTVRLTFDFTAKQMRITEGCYV